MGANAASTSIVNKMPQLSCRRMRSTFSLCKSTHISLFNQSLILQSADVNGLQRIISGFKLSNNIGTGVN